MLSATNLKELIIIPVLTKMGLSGRIAEALTLGTILHESVVGNTQYLAQQPNNGPAHGLGMIEEPTWKWLLGDFLQPAKRQLLKAAVNSFFVPKLTVKQNIEGNLFACVAVIRLRYYASPYPLPTLATPESLAAYWKTVYNTSLGKGDPTDPTTLNCFKMALAA